MATTGEIDVAGVARLARLHLTAEETELFQKQLHRVLEYVDKLKEADTRRTGTETLTDAASAVLRTDDPQDWLTAEEALRNAPRQANDLFFVPKVVE